MIRSVRALGAYVRQALPDDPSWIVEQLSLTTDDGEDSEEPARRRYLGTLDLCPAQRLLRHRLVEVSSGILKRHLWLNLMKAEPGGDIRDVTVRDLRHLLGPVFVGLAPGLLLGREPGQEAPPGIVELEGVLGPVKPVLRDYGQVVNRRVRFLLDFDGFRVEPLPASTQPSEYLRIDEGGCLRVDWNRLDHLDARKRADELAKALSAVLGWGRDVAYVTLALNGRPVAEEPAYRRYIYWYLVERPFAEAMRGRCHLCGHERRVSADFRRFRVKTYITDKTSFAAGLVEDGFTRCYVVCQDCYLDLLLGDRLLEQHLETQLLRTPVFVIPEFATDGRLDYDAVLRRLAEIRQEATELDRLAKLRRAPDDLARAGRERAQRYAYLTLLFHEKQNMAVKVREVVAEVPPSRVQAVIRAINDLNDLAENEGWARPFSDQRNGWFFGLGALLTSLPLRRAQRGPEVRPALTLARQLIQGEPVSEVGLMEMFLETARAIVSQHGAYWVVPQRWAQQPVSPQQVDAELRAFLRRSLALRLLLSRLGCTTRGGVTVDRQVPEPYRSAMAGLELDTQQQPLFLLGVLLARVAHRQFVDSDYSSKPVLEKLNYGGMSLPRVLTFATELFDKLRQYRLLTDYSPAENELLYSLASIGLTSERARWRLTDPENAYFILAGYAYETGRIIQQGQQRPETAKATEAPAAP